MTESDLPKLLIKDYWDQVAKAVGRDAKRKIDEYRGFLAHEKVGQIQYHRSVSETAKAIQAYASHENHDVTPPRLGLSDRKALSAEEGESGMEFEA
jgi:hypothetical protein